MKVSNIQINKLDKLLCIKYVKNQNNTYFQIKNFSNKVKNYQWN